MIQWVKELKGYGGKWWVKNTLWVFGIPVFRSWNLTNL